MKDNEQTMLFLIFHIVVNHLSRLHFYKKILSTHTLRKRYAVCRKRNLHFCKKKANDKVLFRIYLYICK